ncbi:MFS transporter [Gordonia sp. VNQ95]|uniref:MFS transporter n=1 Tax=Gordonia sp. VNQ95 TaxID=3156619 RepID=UPI0032B437DC
MRPAACSPAEMSRYRRGYWSVAFTFCVVIAFSTAPSPLYRTYGERDGLSPLAITLIYAVYAAGVITALYLVGHLSDMLGRRWFLLSSVLLAMLGCVVFMVFPQAPGLYCARVLSGLAVGLTAAAGTAYITELHAAHRPAHLRHRAQLLAATANVIGLGAGAFVAAVIATVMTSPLVAPYAVFLVLLSAAALLIAVAPETTRRSPFRLRDYRLRMLAAPRRGRRRFVGALVGVVLAFSSLGMFVGLSGTVLSQTLHRPSPLLAGFALLVVFGSGAITMIATTTWSTRQTTFTGAALVPAGLIIVLVDVLAPQAGPVVFFVGAAVVGAGGCLLFRASFSAVLSVAEPDRLGETLAVFYLTGYAGLSVPVIGLGLALQHFTIVDTLLVFSVAIIVGLVATAGVIASPLVERTADAV